MVKKIAIGCQGGGVHGAFGAGVLTRILKAYKNNERGLNDQSKLVGFSGTSAGALSALMVWYGLAPKLVPRGSLDGSEDEAIETLNTFWDDFAAKTDGEIMLNSITYNLLKSEEREVKPLGLGAEVFCLNPYGLIYKAVAASLAQFGARKQYYDFHAMFAKAVPRFKDIDWKKLDRRLLIGASEVIEGVETVFDSDRNREDCGHKPPKPAIVTHRWRQRLPLTLKGIIASGTLPTLREAEQIDNRFYWDGLYSQNPPVREFFAGVEQSQIPDELWIVRINPQQCPVLPKTNAEIKDRQNELMGNLSLHKELDFILTVNSWNSRKNKDRRLKYEAFADDHKHVTVRTIKMTKKTADNLRYSSKFNRSKDLINELREEGTQVADGWISGWPNNGEYPDDAGYV
jgi:NTE family protein